MNNSVKMGVMLAAAAMVSGCQSFHMPGFLAKSRPAPQVWHPAPTGDFAEALDQGRAQLRSGNISAAVALFRVAQQSQQTRAEASNGLAVAYAKLGRFDLADRYFRAALAEEPDSERFAANLLRLQQQTLLAQQSALRSRMAASAELQAVRNSSEPVTRDGPVAGRLARVSRGVVFIGTPAQLGPAPSATVVFRERPSPDAITDSAASAEATPAAALALTDKSRTYPIRIEFDR